MILRAAGAEDVALLRRMLAMAVLWRPDAVPRPVADVVADPAVAHYVAGWPRPGDAGVVAEDVDARDVVGGADGVGARPPPTR